jgi:hypothetical protein
MNSIISFKNKFKNKGWQMEIKSFKQFLNEFEIEGDVHSS